MITIRSITYQLPENYTQDHLEKIRKLSYMWDHSFQPIRTQRVSLFPFTKKVPIKTFKELSKLCDVSSIRWFNVPIDPNNSENSNELFNFAYAVLSEYNRAFVNVLAITKDKTIAPSILVRSSELIKKVSTINRNGKDNFRLGLSVNVEPDCPFFPFSYSSGTFGFSIALELTQEINAICSSMPKENLTELRSSIIDTLVPQIREIEIIAESIAKNSGLKFKGFDFSLAPIIDENGSVITILNRLGVQQFGKTGALFATSYITNILKHIASKFPSVGFSGVMYSLLEDLLLCRINNEHGVTLEQMISLSTMCGCGVDMVPVYGQISNDEIMSIILDVAGISCRLNKPLGIRILPIQQCGKNQSIFTSFDDDADFIANTKVVSLSTNSLNFIGESFEYLPL